MTKWCGHLSNISFCPSVLNVKLKQKHFQVCFLFLFSILTYIILFETNSYPIGIDNSFQKNWKKNIHFNPINTYRAPIPWNMYNIVSNKPKEGSPVLVENKQSLHVTKLLFLFPEQLYNSFWTTEFTTRLNSVLSFFSVIFKYNIGIFSQKITLMFWTFRMLTIKAHIFPLVPFCHLQANIFKTSLGVPQGTPMFFLPSETTAVGRTENFPLDSLSKWKGKKVTKKKRNE